MIWWWLTEQAMMWWHRVQDTKSKESPNLEYTSTNKWEIQKPGKSF